MAAAPLKGRAPGGGGPPAHKMAAAAGGRRQRTVRAGGGEGAAGGWEPEGAAGLPKKSSGGRLGAVARYKFSHLHPFGAFFPEFSAFS